ncbi:MAG: class I SAM-dependent methyltransferase, partial [Acidimicrobiales bacterium]
GVPSGGPRRVGRLIESLAAAFAAGEEAWVKASLVGGEPAFGDVWRSTKLVPGWLPECEAAALFVVLSELRPASIVEIGSYLGRSTVFLATTQKTLGVHGSVVAVDPHTGDRQHLEGLGVTELPSFELFSAHLAASGVSERISPVVSTSHDASTKWDRGAVDFLFVDGWHSYESVLEDGRDWLPRLSDHAIAVFDDVVHYEEVDRAVVQLADERVARLYGSAFGKAFMGRAPRPPAAVEKVLGAFEPMTKHLRPVLRRLHAVRTRSVVSGSAVR